MGTSNWQQIPFCIDALMKIEPTRVLDVGVGFGRWGMIVREFCDVWFSRVFREDWKVRLEGIEAFPRSITDYHRAFYNEVHIGDAAALIPTLPGPYSVTIYGDVLEHFTKEKAHELLNLSLDRSDYVIVNIPIGEEHPQGEAYGNVYERHLSSWQPADFEPLGLVRHVLLKDYIERDYGSFVLSRTDPRRLRESLFSKHLNYPTTTTAAAAAGPERDATASDATLDVVVARVKERAFELDFIRRSASYRLATRLRANPLVRMLKSLAGGDRNVLTVRAAGAGGDAPNAVVLSIHNTPMEPGVPWDFTTGEGVLTTERSSAAAYATAQRLGAGSIAARTGPDPKVRLATGPGATRVQVVFNGRTETISLRAAEAGEVTVYPARKPMVPPQAPIEAAPLGASGDGVPRPAHAAAH